MEPNETSQCAAEIDVIVGAESERQPRWVGLAGVVSP